MRRRLALMLLALVLAVAAWLAHGRLAAARARLAAAQAVHALPLPATASPGPAPSLPGPAGHAAAMLRARLAAAAKAEGLLIERIAPAPAPAGLAAADLIVSGREPRVLAALTRIERGVPPVRLSAWSIEAVGGGIRLRGRAVAAWR